MNKPWMFWPSSSSNKAGCKMKKKHQEICAHHRSSCLVSPSGVLYFWPSSGTCARSADSTVKTLSNRWCGDSFQDWHVTIESIDGLDCLFGLSMGHHVIQGPLVFLAVLSRHLRKDHPWISTIHHDPSSMSRRLGWHPSGWHTSCRMAVRKPWAFVKPVIQKDFQSSQSRRSAVVLHRKNTVESQVTTQRWLPWQRACRSFRLCSSHQINWLYLQCDKAQSESSGSVRQGCSANP